MACQAVCCATLEIRFRKRGGGCKVVNDTSIQVSDIDQYLNGIMAKANFHSFIGVRILEIHTRPLQSAFSDSEPDSDSEQTTADDETPPSRAVGGVEQ